MPISTPYGVQGLKNYVKQVTPTSVEYLIVGGGGASSASNGGGGGGGGVLSGSALVTASTTYTITIGGGGSGAGSTGATNVKGLNCIVSNCRWWWRR